MSKDFGDFSNAVKAGLRKMEVAFKLVDMRKGRTDTAKQFDILIKGTQDNYARVIHGLVDCGFASFAEINAQMPMTIKDASKSTSHILYPSNKDWEGFMVGVWFKVGGYTFETVPEATKAGDGGE